MENYELFDTVKEKEPWFGVKITSGVYKDLEYLYTYVSLNEQENGQVVCQFGYEILDSPFELEENEELYNVMGEILTDIIINKEKEINEENRAFNSKQSDQ